MQTSHFNINVKRSAVVFGSDDVVGTIARSLESLTFIDVKAARSLQKPPAEMHFVIAVADFTNNASLQRIAQEYTVIDTPKAWKIVNVLKPVHISQRELLFTAEIGANFTVSGPDRDAQMRDYIKQKMLTAQQMGSIAHFESELERLSTKNDREGLIALDGRLGEMDRHSEEVNRLRALVNKRLGFAQKYESYLKQVLSVNSQNLWAASELGKHYLRMRRPRQGIQILEKLSRYHEMNGERYLALGDAYLNIGDVTNAEANLEKGAELSDNQDKRFNEGKAKVKMMQGDVVAAMDLLEGAQLPESVVSFLNTRAILAIKMGEMDDGVALYRRALSRAPNDDLIRAKLRFNLGLGFVRSERLVEAQVEFEKSLELGGDRFSKATEALEITKKVIEAQGKGQAASVPVDDYDFSFEEFSNESVTGLDKAS